ncbi:MAG: protein-disulfide reductase DsbD family protein, partial [Longimicrobiales bacterium]
AMAVEVPVAGAPPPPSEMGDPGGAQSAPGGPGEAPEERGGGFTLALALAFAFFGGVLLNLMPCVFPVLSLKILGSAGQGGEDRATIRNQGLVFGLGVVLSFLALAGALIALRAGGAQLGWGFQLQSPLFVAAMGGLFFAIGLNLMGVFEVGATLTRLGSKPGAPSGYGESLASGVLATVIATPCTAPFMGAALGFALTRSIPETLLIFGFLGLGMALPYMVLSVAPGLLERLPRPGPWMETMKQVLAFPMFATVIWLVWVFGLQTGVGGTTYLLAALLLVAAAGWMVGRWHRTDLPSGILARGISLGTLALAILAVVRGAGQEPPAMAVQEDWQAFAPEKVESTLELGQPAFVDYTAAWCLTCQVNERLVLSSETVMDAFRERDVALFKADWTRQDPVITASLEALGRGGVPVYALYGGGPGSAPHLLPALLTEEIVLDALADFLPDGG